MSKLVVMRTTEKGWQVVGRTRNGAPMPDSVGVGGQVWAVGQCANLSRVEKVEFNEALHAAGFERIPCSAERVSAWQRADGVGFEVEHLPKKCGFAQRVS